MPVAAAHQDFAFSETQFNQLRKLIAQVTGISISDTKRELVYGRLARRLRALNLSSFDAYLSMLNTDNSVELEHFTNAITTNLTSFFRERHHFDYLSEEFLPYLLRKRSVGKRLRFWCAGCSSGEEPYSLAITLANALGTTSTWDAKILATDLDSNMVAHAAQGLYDETRVEDLADDVVKKWFRRCEGEHAEKFKIHPALRKFITFKQHNLMGYWPMRGPFDVIFCRNVVIYFDKQTQASLFEKYAELLADDGRLIVGHSESLYRVTTRFKLLGKTIYSKTDGSNS